METIHRAPMPKCTPESTSAPALSPQKLQELLAYSRALHVLKPAHWPEEALFLVQN